MKNSEALKHPPAVVVRLPADIAKGWLANCFPYIIITVFTVLFYFPLVLPGMGNQPEGDFYRYFVPFRVYTSLQLHAGDIPFRTNALFGGYPIFQDPQFALLYPVNLLFALLVPDMGNETAIDAYMLANLVILSLAAVFFIRCAGISRLGAIAGACIISFNGFTPTHTDYIIMLQVQAMSLIAAGFMMLYGRGGAADYRLALAAGVALALGNLGGHPQTMVYYHYSIATGVVFLSIWRFRYQ
jgi:hypothetical protein